MAEAISPCTTLSYGIVEQVQQSNDISTCALKVLEERARDRLICSLKFYAFSSSLSSYGKYSLYHFFAIAVGYASYVLRFRLTQYCSNIGIPGYSFKDFTEASKGHVDQFFKTHESNLEKVKETLKMGSDTNFDLTFFQSQWDKLCGQESKLTTALLRLPFTVMLVVCVTSIVLHPYLKYQYRRQWAKYLQLANQIRQKGGQAFDKEDFAPLAIAYSYRQLNKSLSDEQLKMLKDIETFQRASWWKHFSLASKTCVVASAVFALYSFRQVPLMLRPFLTYVPKLSLASGIYTLYALRGFSQAKFKPEVDPHAVWKLTYNQPRTRKWVFF